MDYKTEDNKLGIVSSACDGCGWFESQKIKEINGSMLRNTKRRQQ